MSEEDSGSRPPPRKQSRAKKILSYIKLASDVAGIAMDLRDKPTGMDWFSLGLRATNTAITWYSENTKFGKAISAWDFFNDEGRGWRQFPYEYSKLVVANTHNLYVADEHQNMDVRLPYACLGKLGNETVGWVIEQGTMSDGPYYRVDREAETYAALGKSVWKNLGSKHLLYTPTGPVIDSFKDGTVIPTEQMKDLLDRCQRFLRAGESRSYLLGGVPGTGKSVAIRWLTNTLGMTSMRIDLRLLSDETDNVAGSLETMLNMLQPDVMILDDLDRIEVNAQVLAFLERARNMCRIVIASANFISALSGAATRPGRFDDIITFDKLDLEVVRSILGDSADLAELVADLPAAYVNEFASRCRVLGREQAVEDLDDLRARAEVTSQDSDG